MTESQHSDEALAARIGRGDWAPDATAPRIDHITALVRRRRRRRNAVVIGAASAAAATIAVAALGMPSLSGGDESTGPAATSPTPSATPAPDDSPPPCDRGRLVLAEGGFSTWRGGVTHAVRIRNIGASECMIRVPELAVATDAGAQIPVEDGGVLGLRSLPPSAALIIVVAGPDPRSCPNHDVADSLVVIGRDGFSSEFPVARNPFGGCRQPTVREAYVQH